MKRHLFLLAPIVAFSPAPSMAQGGDATYCARLSELVIRYLGKQINGENRPDAASLVAMDRCSHGDTAAGIPVLERKLQEAGFTLPAR
jgi:hypothetical protein